MDTHQRGARCPGCGAELADAQAQCPACQLAIGEAPPPSSPLIGPARAAEGGTLVADWQAAEVSTFGGAAGTPPAPGFQHLVEPGHHFGPRYLIIKLLGVGGMGAVYQAWDSELGVAVALKMIRPDVGTDPVAARALEKRFKQELLLARQVTHKNVVRIHDLGEIEGLKYISMPFIEGADLATILEKQGKLPVPETMRMARQVAAGLLAAHEAGIVHRDLKPANIMVEQDHALITDFGIARSEARQVTAAAVDAQAGAPDAPEEKTRGGATMSGAIVGTIDYMAPEQARAGPVDQRADIYAFGLIVYDMLLGLRRMRRSDSAFDELARRSNQAPASPRSIDPAIPDPLDRVVMRCLQPDPAARYQTTAELVAALDRLNDNGKLLPLVRRLTPRLMAASAALVLALVAATYFIAQRLVEPPKQHAPVSVLIADFQNGTGDPTFDRTLEPMLKLAMEGAGFISAYDRTGIRSNLGVKPPDTLDERVAQEIAVKQGVGVVLSGAVETRGDGYGVSVKATQAVTGKVLTNVSGTASGKGQVLTVATSLASKVRKALGDDSSGSSQLFAMESLSATSLDTVHDYAGAMDALSNSRFEEALRGFSKTIARDPNFGLGYASMAVALRNLDRHQEAQKYMEEALRHLDGMTERERLRTRGLALKWSGDYPACVKEFGDLIGRYAADAMARNNLAGCLSYLRDLPKAVEEMRQAVSILPKRNLYRENLALYAAYGSDVQTAEREARAIENPGLFGVLPLAFAQVLQGQVPQAAETYQRLATIDEQGASYAASGLADLALYQGRFAEAEGILERGAAADLAAKNPDRAAAKFAALGYARVLRGRNGPAIAAAVKALENSQAVKIRFLAGRVFVEAGDKARVRALAASLASELQAEPQAYAKIIDGEVALTNGNAREAIKIFSAANGLFDTWLGHFDLGRAYLDTGAFIQADSEFDRCIKRRGEAVSLFLDEEPTYAFFPPAYYYQGRVREGLKSERYAESYRAYLTIRGQSKEDPLVPEVRRRAGG